MKQLKSTLLFLGMICLSACTNWNYIDTGVHDPNEHTSKSMMQYLTEHPNNFYLTTAIIQRAGLTELFEGKDPEHPKVMFIAPTKYAIMAGMIRKGYAKTPLKDKEGKIDSFDFLTDVQNIPPDVCKSIILSYTFDKVYLRDEFPQGKRGEGNNLMQDGEVLTSINGNKVWFYRQATAYGIYSNIEVNTIIGIEMDTKSDLYLASTDITVKNGVVHANVDGFMIKDLKEETKQ